MAQDQRPPVWIGHVSLGALDVAESCAFLLRLGMRSIVERDEFAVLELRGGTHLVLRKNDQPPLPGAKAPFDLMYEDIEAVWKLCQELGRETSEISRGKIHDSFTVIDPAGYEIKVNSSHAGDRPV